MKLGVVMLMAGCLAATVAKCGEDPARVAGTVAAAGTTLTAPASGGTAFRLEAVVFGAPAGTTQAVAFVQGVITNQGGGKVVAAADRMLVVTNAPWLFQGDGVRITTSATTAFSAVVTGVTGE